MSELLLICSNIYVFHAMFYYFCIKIYLFTFTCICLHQYTFVCSCHLWATVEMTPWKKMATRKALSVAKTSVWYGFNRRSKKTPYTVPGSVVLNISGRNSERPKWSQKGMRLKYLLSFLIWKKGRGYFKTNRYQHLY